MWRWPELRDIKPDAAAALGGGRRRVDRHRGVPAGPLLPLAARRCSVGVARDAHRAGRGRRGLRRAGARVPADDAGARRARAAAADRVDPLARVHVPPQQLDPLQPPASSSSSRRRSRSSARRSRARRSRSARPSTRRGSSRSGSLLLLLMGVGHALRLEEDEPRRPCGARSASRVIAFGVAVVAAPRGRASARLPRRRLQRPDLPGRARQRAARRSTRSRRSSGISLCVFNAAVIVQEFVLLFRVARAHRGERHGRPTILWWLGGLPGLRLHALHALAASRAAGTAATSCTSASCSMFIGFTGQSWNVDKEASLSPGPERTRSPATSSTYAGERMEVDNNKRMVFADVDVTKNGTPVAAPVAGEVHLQEAARLADDRGRDRAPLRRRRLRHRRARSTRRRRSRRSRSTSTRW